MGFIVGVVECMVWVWWSVSGILRVPKWQIAEGVIMADFHKRGWVEFQQNGISWRRGLTTQQQMWYFGKICISAKVAEMVFSVFSVFSVVIADVVFWQKLHISKSVRTVRTGISADVVFWQNGYM